MSEMFSLQKDKIRVLLLEGVNDSAVELIRSAGYTNLTHLKTALDEAHLIEALQGVHLLGIRSRTQLTGKVLEAANRLIAVGCFSVGTNQVDLEAARHAGIPVFNAPFSNTRSVAELVIGEIVMLLRRIVPAIHRRSCGTVGQVGRRQPRGSRQDARHRRLRQYRLAALVSGRGHGHAGHLLRSDRQAASRQHRAGRQPARLCCARATSSACTCPRRPPRTA